VVQNYANFYCPQKDIHVEGIQTSIRIFVHNNGLTQQRKFREPRNPSRRQV